ncbi:YkgJ family cysteine cluster protein [Methanospirillum stamsii]|uniref:Fe-S oxidoreductase n=1 Tax=Methanospirillum stamsii TaxID=1277351 RepID=A0A2V2N5F5_9EURY|nr:YkgJ family cysteine cluster protein [Methanospirillum stamsii]PWR70741.1 Fe-S oxidoreductase [Methanospirillum stamsii]
MSRSYIQNQLSYFSEELSLLKNWNESELAAIFRDVGFSCLLCGRCCTTDFNGHVFLLDKDAAWVKAHNPEYLLPAPEFELIDDDGVFYVSGYTLKARENGTCPYLNHERCTIYENRFSICRIYPYMLHREPDRKKQLKFRQISGLNEHGEYNQMISDEELLKAAKETIAYESEWLSQMIDFFSAAQSLFINKGFSHVRKAYDQRIQEFRRGIPVEVYVWYQGKFVLTTVRCEEYAGFGWP